MKFEFIRSSEATRINLDYILALEQTKSTGGRAEDLMACPYTSGI